MAKTKNKKNKNLHNCTPLPGELPLRDFANRVFKERAGRFQKKGTAIDSVYEGLDLDAIRIKRRVSSVLSVVEEVKSCCGNICPDIPGRFSLAEDWVLMNTCPVSAFDHIEKYVFSTLGAAIWLLDHIRDTGKLDQLNEILSNAKLPGNVEMPDVWDPCHSQQMLQQMVSIINNRNADCPVTEKAILKNKATVTRIYMDRPTAENKIDHTVPSRFLYDQIIALIDPKALSLIEDTYNEKYWDWLNRYFRCRALFNEEEQQIRSEIQDFQCRIEEITAKTDTFSKNAKQLPLLSNTGISTPFPALNSNQAADHLFQLKSLEYQNKVLYEKQSEFNARLSSFTREIGEFSLMPFETIAMHYSEKIANIWKDFEIEEPYSMCMAFLSLLDRGSDLPWCYFPSVILQSCYVSMLPWTRTKFSPGCDNIWEHYDDDADSIVPGPSEQPLPKKTKVPDLDSWYRMQFRDIAKSKSEQTELFSLSQILYEATGCLMPRNLQRHLAGLNTFNRYGINSKKTNLNLLYCMALLGEAKHRSHLNTFPVFQDTDSGELPDTVEELQAQVIALREELSQCKQSLQEVSSKSGSSSNQISQIKRHISNRDVLIHDLSSIVFKTKLPTATNSTGFPYRIASSFVVFAADEAWLKQINKCLPDILYFSKIAKGTSDVLRSMDTIWIQPNDMSFDEYRRILTEARKHDVPVRIFPFTDVISCASLIAHADISR
jgi:hypothetical protein